MLVSYEVKGSSVSKYFYTKTLSQKCFSKREHNHLSQKYIQSSPAVFPCATFVLCSPLSYPIEKLSDKYRCQCPNFSSIMPHLAGFVHSSLTPCLTVFTFFVI